MNRPMQSNPCRIYHLSSVHVFMFVTLTSYEKLHSFNLNLNEIFSSCVFFVRVAVATRFQRSFIQLLKNAEFEELSAMDLGLTSALNTDYLLTLPIYVDWKRASESNAIIFRF